MVSTSTGSELGKDMAKMILNAFDDGMRQAARMLWNILLSYLETHWLGVMAVVFAIFIIAFFKAMFGRWGMLGSVLYNLLYFGILFVVSLKWGPEVFVNDYFNTACAVFLYPICYFVVGLVLDKLGVRR